MMEALEQQKTKIESNLDDAPQKTQNEEEIRNIVENENSKIVVEEDAENLNKTDEHVEVSETAKNAPTDAEATTLQSSDSCSTDHNDDQEAERKEPSTHIITKATTVAAAPEEEEEEKVVESPDASVVSEQNRVDLNLSNFSQIENHEKPKSPPTKLNTKIVLVDYDDEDEEELLKSDSDVEQRENVEINKETSAKEVLKISLEKEDELLKSDEEDAKEIDVKEMPKTDETKENENNAINDKEVVTISDEEEEYEDQSLEKSQKQSKEEEKTSNNIEEAEKPSPSNEIINIDDDSVENANLSATSNNIESKKNTPIKKTTEDEADEDEISKRNQQQQAESNYEYERRLLYKFEIDDSRENDCHEDMDEESHDTFASINDDSRLATEGDSNEDANLKLLAASAENELERVKDRAEMVEKDPVVEEEDNDVEMTTTMEAMPKVNGDHNSLQETEEKKLEVQKEQELNDVQKEKELEVQKEKELVVQKEKELDVQKEKELPETEDSVIAISDPSSEQTQSEEMLTKEEHEIASWPQIESVAAKMYLPTQVEQETHNDLNKTETEVEESKEETAQPDDVIDETPGILTTPIEAATEEDVDVIDEDDDEGSRCSSLASSVASSATSSSHQLVIDHPMEDLPDSNANNNEKPLMVAPLKLTLKRKLSNSSDNDGNYVSTSPLQKQPHLELLDDGHESPEMPTNLTAYAQNEIPEQPQNHVLPMEFQEQQEKMFAENVPPQPLFKSLLLEQLQKPRTPPVAIEPFMAMDTLIAAPVQTPPPPLQSTLLGPPPPSTLFAPAQPTGATKYLCFKCKIGCFDTFAALNDHQLSCLSSSLSALLPTVQLAKADTPPPLLAVEPPASATPTTALFVVPATPPPPPQKIRYYKCSTCGTYHENWNLFLHIHEKHNRHMCLYCIRFFPTAEKLSLHLEIKHDLEQNHFNSEEALRLSQRQVETSTGIESDIAGAEQDSESETRLLMCCTCQHVFREHEPFSDHICSEYMKPCALCGQKGRHTNQCKAHPDAKRRASKIKKKTTTKPRGAGAHGSSTALDISAGQSSSHSTARHTSSYCDNSQQQQQRNSNATSSGYSNFALPPSTAHATTTQQQQPHSEDSNDSSNMVIDESCTNTTHHANSLVNPFKALDERERAAERQFQTQPLDAVDDEKREEKPQLKVKLCVPKMWQKPVNAAISSTDESEEGEEEEYENATAGEENTTAEENQNLESTAVQSTSHGNDNKLSDKTAEEASTSKAADALRPAVAETSRQNATGDEEESLEEAPNSNMKRLLAEIERTKEEIQHTKESLHHPSKTPSVDGGTPQRQPTLSQSSSRTTERWSPTPPASPNLRWSLGEQQPPQALKMSSLAELPPPSLPPLPPVVIPTQQLERRDTIGSDAMDIDETIGGNDATTTASTQLQSPPENTLQNTSENLDTSTGSSTNVDIECNSSTEHDAQGMTPQTQPLSIDDVLPKPEEEMMAEPPLHESPPHEAFEGDSPFTGINPESTEIKDDQDDQEEDEQEIDVCDKPEEEAKEPAQPEPPADGIEVANEDTLSVDLQLDRPLEKFEIVEFVRICLKAVYPLCLYCNHARRIAVNGANLVLHMIAQHRFTATVDSITAEELKSETIVAKLKSFLPDLESEYFNSTSYCTIGEGQFTRHFNERIFECFQCRFVTTTHKELYLHNRKMHLKTAILCFMCRANFYSFSEVLCHICPGAPGHTPVSEVKFRCCLCEIDNIPSPFRMMVHLRKRHFACDVCLEDCREQSKLSSHVWKHKLSHLCYRCGIAYRNKMDITKHLFWKHGTESIICKRCMQKRWRHVYHFCVPPPTFVCDVCQLTFSKAVYLKVHKRIHTGDLRYPCTEENCAEKFISRRLMLKHTGAEHPPVDLLVAPEKAGELEKLNEDKPELTETGEAIKQEGVEIKKEVAEGEVTPKGEAKEDESEIPKKEMEPKGECKKEDVEKSKSIDRQTKSEDKPVETTTRKKKKKNKRSKESLEDLNLIAPNLSETDSSDDSGTETKSRTGEENELVPKVMLSPPSETENDMTEAAKLGNEADRTGKVLEIWKNFLQAQGDTQPDDQTDAQQLEKEIEELQPKASPQHVGNSDHDYCLMQSPPTPPPPEKTKSSPSKRKNSSKSPRRTNSTHRAGGKDSSSSSGDSSSSSDSSCSCGSNCSCSSSGSDSSSSSSSSDDSNSSGGSNASRKKRQRKKSERGQRKKSESISPLKKKHNNHSETLNVEETDDKEAAKIPERSPSPPQEPLFYESDLETAESDTDEEFYDEHPQLLASVLLAQKRAELMAQRRLSPSHNYDIVENSRPSTPSLPEDVAASAGAAHEKKSKLKKKKRDRKSTSKSEAAALKFNIAKTAALLASQQQPQQHSPHTGALAADFAPPYDLMQSSSPGVAEPPVAQQPLVLPPQAHHHRHHYPPPPSHHQHIGGGRISEGSSCSDADASLKRSKRVPRPNKFFGFDGEDENNGASSGGGGNATRHHPQAQSLMIGMRVFKPQPPPQLTWSKEDLPTPSKSILNNKNKVPRTPRTPASAPPLGIGGGDSLFLTSDTPLTSQTITSKKKRQQQRHNVTAIGGLFEKSLKRKRRPSKKNSGATTPATPKLPPIPTLKIRGIGSAGGTNHIPASQIYSSSKESDDDDSSADFSSADEMAPNKRPKPYQQQLINASTSHNANLWNTTLQMATAADAAAASSPVVFQAAQVLPPPPPPIVLPSAPPIPQASVFNHKIPPALLPNPDFATLQYFKANNIRYPIRPPAGARQPREGESVYCYCRCPYDEVSEMIACDGENCLIEWFHFECVGIMVAPQGKWFCAECRPKYSEELYPNSTASH